MIDDRPSPPTRALASRVALALGSGAVASAVWLVPSELHSLGEYGDRPAAGAAVAVLMALLWLTEAVPIAVTAVLPLVLHPLLGVYGRGPIGDAAAATSAFADGYLLLFLGGMMLGAAMEQWNLHRRIALHVLARVGSNPRNILLGVLLATAGVSMWISNTATAVMMLPIAMALRVRLEEASGKPLPQFGCALALAVAYASNVGGIGTKIGTGTNSIFCGYLAEVMDVDLSFPTFMAIGTPFVVLFLPIVWGALWVVGRRDAGNAGRTDGLIPEELARMGPPSPRERQVALVFLGAAVLWVFGDPLRQALQPWLPELWDGFVWRSKHWEAAVAVVAGGGLLLTGGLSWTSLLRVPWSALVLLGGSFAMAAGIEGSGLATWMATRIAALAALPLPGQLLVSSAAAVVLSAVASNTATVNVLLQVLPRSLPVLTATMIASSCDFMLPAGTPPNAIVFGSGVVRLPTMIRVGFALDVAAVLLITLYCWVWVGPILGI